MGGGITAGNIRAVYDMDTVVIRDPVTAEPMMVSAGREECMVDGKILDFSTLTTRMMR